MIKELIQLPNLLSLSRILLAPVVVYLMSQRSTSASKLSLAIVVLAAITDGLDGWLARRMNKVSRLGIALDPICDKIFAGILVIALIAYRQFPFWLALAIIGRDLLILVGGTLLFRSRKVVIPSNLTGKYAFASIAFLIVSYLIEFEFGKVLSTVVTVALVTASTINYGLVFVRVRKGQDVPVFKDRPVYRNARLIMIAAFSAVFLYRLFSDRVF